MTKVTILGGGNLAHHLLNVFNTSANITVVQWYQRNIPKTQKENTHLHTDTLNDLKDADIYFLAISDDAISSFSEKLPFSDKFVVHCSGSVAIDTIKGNNRKGVFYPLQTFSKNRSIHFKEIPIALEAVKPKDLLILKHLANEVSNKVYEINSDARRQLHLAAVIVNNFVNHLYSLGHEICKANNIPFEILHPLINETSEKIKSLTPMEAQTGPAKRNDERTIESQLQLLDEQFAEYKTIYNAITASIQTTYERR